MACANTSSSYGDCSGSEKEDYMDDTRETIRRLFQQLLQKNNDTRGFTDTDSLILGGRFQSLDVLEITSVSTFRKGSTNHGSIRWKKS